MIFIAIIAFWVYINFCKKKKEKEKSFISIKALQLKLQSDYKFFQITVSINFFFFLLRTGSGLKKTVISVLDSVFNIT